MDNKTMLEGILWDLKSLADLFMHGAIESSTKNVHESFKGALNDTLTMQNDLYTLMSNENMYSVSNVSESKITKTKTKFKETLEEE